MKNNTYYVYCENLFNCPYYDDYADNRLLEAFNKFAHFYLPEPDVSGAYIFNQFDFSKMLDEAYAFSRDWFEHLTFTVVKPDGHFTFYDYNCGYPTIVDF